MARRAAAAVLATSAVLSRGACPFGEGGPVPEGHPSVRLKQSKEALKEYGEAVKELDFDAVKADIKALLTDSKKIWPADFGNYGPFFVRLAWHCSGSYRASDGRGGCEGGHQRFEPERSWADNTNLDKARNLLVPIKVKYGKALSWGDLFVLAGTTAIEAMGGPVLGFCGGRVDADDGTEIAPLGPSTIQEKLYPCPLNGTCENPLGSTTVGLIYLNPEGPLGIPEPIGTVKTIRDAFGRMAMNDSETIALIGGGHAFGKSHGACPAGAGPSPVEDPANPWPGLCGTGKGKDTWTSGFELQWTPKPTQWDNVYFQLLLEYEWEKAKGPSDHWQWYPKDASPELANVGMLTSDVSLIYDPEYKSLVELWAQDLAGLDNAFAHAWYKLTSRDMGPVQRCVGQHVPPAQPFQYPLPPAPIRLPSFAAVEAAIKKVLGSSNDDYPADKYKEGSTYGPLFVHLAWQCASSYRDTDHSGGCNGARLRFSPEKEWPSNAGLDETLQVLQPIKEEFGDSLTWADLIVLAGTVAIEDAGGPQMKFCGGRSDALDGKGSEHLSERPSTETTDADVMKNWMRIKGFSSRDFVALVGGGHSLGQKHESTSGYSGAWTADPTTFSNDFFTGLFAEDWELVTEPYKKEQYKAKGKDLWMLKSDLLLKFDPEFSSIATEYASDASLLASDFAYAWTRLMNADRFDGPTGNVCDGRKEEGAVPDKQKQYAYASLSSPGLRHGGA